MAGDNGMGKWKEKMGGEMVGENGRGNGTGIWTGICFGMSGFIGLHIPQNPSKMM